MPNAQEAIPDSSTRPPLRDRVLLSRTTPFGSEDLAVAELLHYRGYHSATQLTTVGQVLCVSLLSIKLESPSTYHSFDLLDSSTCFTVVITFILIYFSEVVQIRLTRIFPVLKT